jgi:hypothetical protein
VCVVGGLKLTPSFARKKTKKNREEHGTTSVLSADHEDVDQYLEHQIKQNENCICSLSDLIGAIQGRACRCS